LTGPTLLEMSDYLGRESFTVAHHSTAMDRETHWC